jgi:hypothetical protein
MHETFCHFTYQCRVLYWKYETIWHSTDPLRVLYWRYETIAYSTDPSRVPYCKYKTTLPCTDPSWVLCRKYKTICRPTNPSRVSSWLCETYVGFRFKITKPFSFYGTKKGSLEKLRNDFFSTEPKIVPCKDTELKKFGKIPIFFRVKESFKLF